MWDTWTRTSLSHRLPCRMIVVTLFGLASLLQDMLLLVLSPELESSVFIVGLRYEQHPNLFAAFALLLGAYMTYSGFHAETRSVK